MEFSKDISVDLFYLYLFATRIEYMYMFNGAVDETSQWYNLYESKYKVKMSEKVQDGKIALSRALPTLTA